MNESYLINTKANGKVVFEIDLYQYYIKIFIPKYIKKFTPCLDHIAYQQPESCVYKYVYIGCIL